MNVNAPTHGESESLGAAIRRGAREEGDRVVVTVGDRAMSWRELDERSDRLASVLARQGVSHDDAVSLVLPNGFSFILTAVAVWKLGATPHLLSLRMPQSELAQLLELARPAAVSTTLPVETTASIVDPELVPDTEPIVPSVIADPVPSRWAAFASGGSTGRPKIVVADQAGVVGPGSDIEHLIRGYSLDRETVLLVPGPLPHAGPFGFATYTLFARGQIVLMERFDPEETLRLIDLHGVTTLFVVPTMMNRIMKLDPAVRERYDVSSLQTVWHAAAPCPAWLKQLWIDWLGPERIEESYGASDAAALTRIDGVEWLTHPGSVGRPAFGEVAIFDENKQRLPAGEVGDIYMRPPAGAMKRTYIGSPPPATVDGGWSTVGDMGWLDEEGYLYLADRRVDLIVSGGFNVYPAEVESVLEAHPLVLSSAVVGIPDDDLGKRVHAVVQVTGPVSTEELRAFVFGRLASYKVPRSFELVDDPVRDDAGKVRRSAHAQRAAEEFGAQPG
jgi:bile acid-coenzyme A ligase